MIFLGVTFEGILIVKILISKVSKKYVHFLGIMWFMPLLSTFFIMSTLKLGKILIK